MSRNLTSDTSYKTALEIMMFYINNANIEAAHALLKDQELLIDMTNDIGMTPLHQAVKVNNLNWNCDFFWGIGNPKVLKLS